MLGELELFSIALTRLFWLIWIRCLGTVWFAPILSGGNYSRLQKLSFSFLLAFLVFPAVSSLIEIKAPEPLTLSWGCLCPLICEFGSEFVLGAVIGLLLKIYFQGVLLAGEMIARIGGVSVSQCFDPMLGEELSSPSSFLFWISLAVFIVCGGLEAFLDGYLTFFSVILPGYFGDLGAWAMLFTQILSNVFSMGLRLSAPVICATAVVYIAVGFNGRLFSQFNLSLISFNFTVLLTLFLFSIGIGVICQVLRTEFLEGLMTFFDSNVK